MIPVSIFPVGGHLHVELGHDELARQKMKRDL